MANYIDEEEEIDNSAEEACEEGGGGPDNVKVCKVPKSKAYKAKVRKDAVKMFAKGKKFKLKKKPVPDDGDGDDDKKFPESQHRNVRFL